MGNVLRALDSDKPNVKGISVVKDKALQGRIDTAAGDYDFWRNNANASLSDYLTRFLASEPEANRLFEEESTAIDPFYNGAYRGTHDRLRSEASAAREAAAERYGLKALAALKRGSIANEGGPGSWATRALMGTLEDVGVQNAVDEAAQARADYESEMQAPIMLAGRRMGMRDALTGRALEPFRASSQVMGAEQGFLNNLANIIHGNKDYGVYKKRSGLEKAADIIDAIHAVNMEALGTTSQVAGAAGGAAGAGAGGGGGGMSL